MADETEIARELAALRKEVYEARSLVIKTDNLLKTFHVELRNVAGRQELAEKRHLIGHAAAYLVIGVLAGGGALLWARSAGEAGREEAQRLLAEAQESQARAKAAEEKAETLLDSQEQASSRALAAFELMNAEDPVQRAEGLERAASIDVQSLTPFARQVLQGEEREIRGRLANEAYEAGLTAHRRNDLKQARVALGRFFEHAERLPPDFAPEARVQAAYYLGATLNQLGEHEEATRRLGAFLAGDGSRSMRAYASLLLGDSLEQLGKTAEARAAFEAGIQADPSGQTAQTLRRRLARLQAPAAPAE